MSTIFTSLTANYSANNLGYLPPVTNGLVSWYRFGTSAAASLVDYSPLKRNGTWSGLTANYTFSSGYASFLNASQANANRAALITPVVDVNAQDITHMVVVRSNDTFASANDLPVFVSNLSTDTSNPSYPSYLHGLSINVSATAGAPDAVIQATDAYGATGSTPNKTNLTRDIPASANFNTKFKVLLVTYQTVGSTTTRTIYNLTDGTNTVATTAGPRAANTTQAFRYGCDYYTNNVNVGNFDIAIGAIWNRCLTSTEINAALYPAVKRNLSQYSIVV